MTGKETEDNPLLLPLDQIPSNSELVDDLTVRPNLPVRSAPDHFYWPYDIEVIYDLAIPDGKMLQIARSVDRLLRSSYKSRDPSLVSTKKMMYSQGLTLGVADRRPRGMFVEGLSGTGKTSTILRTLARYPQLYTHKNEDGCFPDFKSEKHQLVWLYVEVPASGKLKDLAKTLIQTTAEALGDPEQANLLIRDRQSGAERFDRWLQMAKSRFLGILVLDEAQNIFRLESIRQRHTNSRRKLRVAEDEMLKTLVQFVNWGQIPLVLAGTPDASELLARRLAFAQRLATGGNIKLNRFTGPEDIGFSEHLVPQLLEYQFAASPLGNTCELRELIYNKTAGIRRMIIQLWHLGHQVAADNEENLDFKHIEIAADTYMDAVQPAVTGLITGDPDALTQYEDAVSKSASRRAV